MFNFVHPNLHPLIVHFPIALLLTSIVAFSSSIIWRRREPFVKSAINAGDWMLGLGVIAMIVAIAAGLDAYGSVAHDAPSHSDMTTHRNWAFGTGLAFLVVATWRWFIRKNRPTILFILALTLSGTLLSVTAWWGGRLVFEHGIGVERLTGKEIPIVQPLPTENKSHSEMMNSDGHDHVH